MKKPTLKRILYTLLGLVIISLLAWITYSQTTTINQLRLEGKPYNVGAVTVLNGKDGKSTYELAVDNGFRGSLTDWLISQAVEPIKGNDGAPGASAYDVAREYGFKGTVVDWLLSLKGQAGIDAPQLTSEQQYTSWVAYCAVNTCQGTPGIDGINGTNADPVIFSCVIRNVLVATVPTETHYLSWRYSLEPNTAYRDQYEIPLTQKCTNPVDLRTPLTP